MVRLSRELYELLPPAPGVTLAPAAVVRVPPVPGARLTPAVLSPELVLPLRALPLRSAPGEPGLDGAFDLSTRLPIRSPPDELAPGLDGTLALSPRVLPTRSTPVEPGLDGAFDLSPGALRGDIAGPVDLSGALEFDLSPDALRVRSVPGEPDPDGPVGLSTRGPAGFGREVGADRVESPRDTPGTVGRAGGAEDEGTRDGGAVGREAGPVEGPEYDGDPVDGEDRWGGVRFSDGDDRCVGGGADRCVGADGGGADRCGGADGGGADLCGGAEAGGEDLCGGGAGVERGCCFTVVELWASRVNPVAMTIRPARNDAAGKTVRRIAIPSIHCVERRDDNEDP